LVGGRECPRLLGNDEYPRVSRNDEYPHGSVNDKYYPSLIPAKAGIQGAGVNSAKAGTTT